MRIQSSSNYDEFRFIGNNRNINNTHVKALETAFEEFGNLTKVQPILVNERMEIIDGQHRFIAAQKRGEPIYFTVRPGLTITDARDMNMLHRGWSTDDFARSFADGGDVNYKKYLELREEYGFTQSVILAYAANRSIDRRAYNEGSPTKAFRRGEWVLEDEEATRERLDMLAEVFTSIEKPDRTRPFALAFLKVLNVPEFDFSRFLRKIQKAGDVYIRRYSSKAEYLRAMEDMYNHGYSDAGRARLF